MDAHPTLREMRSLLTISDLSDEDLDGILQRAGELRRGEAHRAPRQSRLVALLFFEPSLRTRIGFAAAAARLGWQSIEVTERRHSPTSMLESWFDTLRVVSSYADVVVTRPGEPLNREELTCASRCPVINGGDTGLSAQHPTQALLDVFAIQEIAGPLAGISIAIVGDPRMRAVRSLLELFTRQPPATLSLIADPEHAREVRLPETLQSKARFTSWESLEDVDVIYVAGIPHASLPLGRREALLVTAARVERLPPRCIILSPMPVIDEIASEVRLLPRIRMYEQSDLGLFVRMAILEHVVSNA